VPLANLAPGDFVFFSAYALAGLVPPVSSFFLMLLEFYELQLQHLSPNSITLVAIFIHLYEMFMGGAAVGAPVPSLLRDEGSEPAPAAHRRLLLCASDAAPLPVYCPCLLGQVGALERRLGSDVGGCP
jgi:hypothetical protein